MALINSKIINDISVITLTGGVTNPINLETILAMLSEMNKISSDNMDVKGLILTSANNKFFSIGFDIPILLKLDKAGLGEFINSFNELCLRLYTLPIPTRCAITGHYVAAGCILAACTDSRIIVDGRAKTGITAIKLGLPVPILAQGIVRSRITSDYADELLSTGDLYDISWAKNAGFINSVTDRKQILEKAIECINAELANEAENHTQMKRIDKEGVVNQYLAEKDENNRNFVETWFTPKVQLALKEASKKF